jgi:tellurite resistance protein TerC
VNKSYKLARKLIFALVGFTVIGIGLALLVLPGPGILVIIAGLAILAVEFEWAERYLNKVKKQVKELPKKARSRKKTN